MFLSIFFSIAVLINGCFNQHSFYIHIKAQQADEGKKSQKFLTFLRSILKRSFRNAKFIIKILSQNFYLPCLQTEYLIINILKAKLLFSSKIGI